MFCLICVFSCLPRLSGSPTLNPWSEVICENNDVLAKEREIILSHRSMCWSNRGRSRERVQGVCTPPGDDLRFSNTTGILQKKNNVVYWC